MFEPPVGAAEGIEELDSRGGEVHDVVGESRWYRDDRGLSRRGYFGGRAGARRWREQRYGVCAGVGGEAQEGVSGGADEGPAVEAGGGDKWADLGGGGGLVGSGSARLGCTHLVQLDVLLQALVALGVQIVRPDKHPLLPGRHRKWTDPSHNIRDGLPRTKLTENPLVLITESCVPIHLREIEPERTPTLVHFDLGICRSCEHLHGKRAELGLGADVFDFVDDGGDAWVLVYYDGRDQVLIGGVLGTEVEVGEMASLRERLRDLGHEVFGED